MNNNRRLRFVLINTNSPERQRIRNELIQVTGVSSNFFDQFFQVLIQYLNDI